MTTTSQFIQIIGLMGPPMFLYPYAMVSLGRWQSTDFRFHLLNFLGASCVLLSLIEQWNLAVCVLEACWASIGLYGMIRAKRRA